MGPRTSGRARPGTPGSTNTPAMARGLRNTSSSTFNPNFEISELLAKTGHLIMWSNQYNAPNSVEMAMANLHRNSVHIDITMLSDLVSPRSF